MTRDYRSICDRVQGKYVNEDLCMVDGYPLALSDADYLYEFKPESQIITSISPEEFLNSVPFKPLDKKHVEELKKKMKEKHPIDPPFIDLDFKTCKIIGHEGRHRAKAALELDINKIPVIIYCRDGETGEYVDKEKCRKCLIKLTE